MNNDKANSCNKTLLPISILSIQKIVFEYFVSTVLCELKLKYSFSVCYFDIRTQRQTGRQKKIEFMYTHSLNTYDFIQLDSYLHMHEDFQKDKI